MDVLTGKYSNNQSQSREMRLLGKNFIKIKARQTERTERQTGPHPRHFSGPITPGFKISFSYFKLKCAKKWTFLKLLPFTGIFTVYLGLG